MDEPFRGCRIFDPLPEKGESRLHPRRIEPEPYRDGIFNTPQPLLQVRNKAGKQDHAKK